MSPILFYLFAALTLIFGIGVVANRNPVASALCLVVSFLGLAALFVGLDAYFIAVVQVLVYAGAVMVLFTFVVMLLNAGREERTLGSRSARAVGFPAVTVILALIATVIVKATGLNAARSTDAITTTEDLSKVLFRELLLPFEVTSVLILIAILGAVALARNTDGERTAGK